MSCYHPLLRVPRMEYIHGIGEKVCTTSNGEVCYSIRKPLHSEIEWMDREAKLLDPSIGCLIPCGHCIGCRLDQSRQWADRMLMELEATEGKKAVFLTLTYENPEGVWITHPESKILGYNYTLRKKDLQDFNKRLRFRFKERKLRVYGAGEYGESTLRPHYHEIIFGIDLEDLEARPFEKAPGVIAKNPLGDIYYTSDVISDKWPLGLHSIGQVTWKSCAYVARYVAKKWSTGMPDWIFGEGKLEKPFTIMSLKPGIGLPYVEKWQQDPVHEDLNMLEFNTFGIAGKKIKLPRYIKEKLGEADPEKLLEIKIKALVSSQERREMKLSKTDLDLLDLLSAEEEVKKEAVKGLKRNAL